MLLTATSKPGEPYDDRKSRRDRPLKTKAQLKEKAGRRLRPAERRQNRRWGNRRYHLLFGFTPFWEIAPDETN
jgi:hypothetical protein